LPHDDQEETKIRRKRRSRNEDQEDRGSSRSEIDSAGAAESTELRDEACRVAAAAARVRDRPPDLLTF